MLFEKTALRSFCAGGFSYDERTIFYSPEKLFSLFYLLNKP